MRCVLLPAVSLNIGMVSDHHGLKSAQLSRLIMHLWPLTGPIIDSYVVEVLWCWPSRPRQHDHH